MLGSVSSLNASSAASPTRFKLASGQLAVPAVATASMSMSPVSYASAPATAGAYYHASLMPAQASTQTNATQAHVSFGSCICPICASLAIIVETHNKIKKLQYSSQVKTIAPHLFLST